MDERFHLVHRHMDGRQENLDRRLGLIEERLDRLMTGMLGTQEAQRRAIDDILQRMNPPQ